MKKMIGIVMVALFAGLGANATLVTLAPDADADIRSMDLANIGYNRETLSVVNGNADPSLYRDAKAYIRFKLPDDFGTATSATFTIVRATMGAWNPVYNVNGLDDGISGETDWIEANTTGVNWNNAPGNITTSANEFTDSVLVGSFAVKNSGNGGFLGDTHTVSGTDLVDFLNADSNGYITLMIGRMGGSSTSSDSFASRTHTTYDAPSLDLEYTVIPEPATLGLILTTGLGLIVIRKRMMI